MNPLEIDAYYGVKTVDRVRASLPSVRYPRLVRFAHRRERARFYCALRRSMARFGVAFSEMSSYCHEACIAIGRLGNTLREIRENEIRANIERYNEKLTRRVRHHARPKWINGRLRR